MTPKKFAVGAAVVVVSESASRGTIHDEVSTILRANKVKDLTVQMVKGGVVPSNKV